MTENVNSIQSQGGQARAEVLSPEERKTIARKGATARWGLRVTHEDRPIKIGDIEIPCAVLEGGIRVLSERAVTKALGGKRGGSHWRRMKENPTGAQLPVYLSANNLKPFIENTLESAPERLVYTSKNGGKTYGLRAELLPKICNIFLKARDAGVLKTSQFHIAAEADILMRGLAEVGIIALVDEATGNQADRARDALAKILEKFIAVELRPWTRTFPLEFYERIFKLQGWLFDPKNVKRPGVLGHYTNNLVYRRLAPGVLDALRKKNPVIDGRRKHKHFQWLTGEIGDPKLRAHIEGVVALMRISSNWDEFVRHVQKAYPIIETTELGFQVELSERLRK